MIKCHFQISSRPSKSFGARSHGYEKLHGPNNYSYIIVPLPVWVSSRNAWSFQEITFFVILLFYGTIISTVFIKKRSSMSKRMLFSTAGERYTHVHFSYLFKVLQIKWCTSELCNYLKITIYTVTTLWETISEVPKHSWKLRLVAMSTKNWSSCSLILGFWLDATVFLVNGERDCIQ